MRLALLGLTLLLAACQAGTPASRQESDARASRRDWQDPSERPRVPWVAPNVAPGVLFDHLYAFSLGADGVAPLQDRQVERCTRLGAARCRVVSMRYRRTGADDIDAMTEFQVDPALAGQFAKGAIELASGLKAILVYSDIRGERVPAVPGATPLPPSDVTLREEQARLRKMFEDGIDDDHRAEFEARLREIGRLLAARQSALNAPSAQGGDGAAAREGTRIVLTYAAGAFAPANSTYTPISDALVAARDNLIGFAAAVIEASGFALPVLVLLLLLALLLRRLGVRRPRRARATRSGTQEVGAATTPDPARPALD